MFKATFIGGLGVILLNLAWISAVLQAAAVLIQSIRYNMFVYFGGWTWTGWSIAAALIGLVFVGIGFLFFDKK